LISKDVLPAHIPIKNVRTFYDICKFFLFPFTQSTLADPANQDSSAGTRS
jgi:hypothetical protein